MGLILKIFKSGVTIAIKNDEMPWLDITYVYWSDYGIFAGCISENAPNMFMILVLTIFS